MSDTTLHTCTCGEFYGFHHKYCPALTQFRALERDLAAERAAREKAEAKVARLREALERLLAAYTTSYSSEYRMDCWQQARAAMKDTDG